MIKIALVDDHELFLNGLKSLLATIDEIEIVETFDNGTSLLDKIEQLDIDVLLLLLKLGVSNTVGLIKHAIKYGIYEE